MSIFHQKNITNIKLWFKRCCCIRLHHQLRVGIKHHIPISDSIMCSLRLGTEYDTNGMQKVKDTLSGIRSSDLRLGKRREL